MVRLAFQLLAQARFPQLLQRDRPALSRATAERDELRLQDELCIHAHGDFDFPRAGRHGELALARARSARLLRRGPGLRPSVSSPVRASEGGYNDHRDRGVEAVEAERNPERPGRY
jgi:hypothetical protein